jgi:hypothetical protein
MRSRFVVLVLCAIALLATVARGQPPPRRATAARPNLSGYWGAGRAFRATETPPANTVVLADAGAPELPSGNFGGLKVRPAALAAAMTWKPQDEMTISRVCLPPSIVYSMQGPFPMEIHQASELIVMRLEYYDLVRVIFLDRRQHLPASAPHTKVGDSVGRWEGDTLVVETTHLSESTITNNGLNHSDNVRMIERFWLSADGKTLMSRQEFEDPDVLENRGARYVAWDRGSATDHIFPYECDPSFAANYPQTGKVEEVKKVEK